MTSKTLLLVEMKANLTFEKQITECNEKRTLKPAYNPDYLH